MNLWEFAVCTCSKYNLFYNLSVEFTGQSSKKRHTLMFSYDVGQIENISETVDSILKEWTQIVYLYAAVDQLVRYLRWDALNVR